MESLGWLGSDSIQVMTPSIRARASVPEGSAMGAPRRPARRSSLARRRMASPRLSATAMSIFSQTPNSSRRSPNRGRNPLQDFFVGKFISTSRYPKGNPKRSGIQFLAHIDMHTRTLKMHRNLLEYFKLTEYLPQKQRVQPTLNEQVWLNRQHRGGRHPSQPSHQP